MVCCILFTFLFEEASSKKPFRPSPGTKMLFSDRASSIVLLLILTVFHPALSNDDDSSNVSKIVAAALTSYVDKTAAENKIDNHIGLTSLNKHFYGY
jgi:hypothetical protein